MPRTRSTGLGSLLSSKVMPLAVFVLALFFLPLLFTVINHVPSLYLYFYEGAIGLQMRDPPLGATAIDLRVVAVLLLFLLPVFFLITIVDRFASRI